jgi:autotransporter-associated beta strand protein
MINFKSVVRRTPVVCKSWASLLLAALFLLSGVSARAQTSTWQGATGADWGTAGSWNPSGVPGSGATALFSATGTISVANAIADESITNITFAAGAGVYTVGGVGTNSLLLQSGGEILNSASNIETINAPIVLEGANGTYAFSSSSGTAADVLNFGGTIQGGASGTTTLTLEGTNTAGTNYSNISGVISDGSATHVAIATTGSSSWELSGGNSYSGGTTLGGTGYLEVSGSSVTSGSVGSETLVSGPLGTGALTITGTGRFEATGSPTIANSVVLNNAGTTTMQGVVTFDGTGLSTPATIMLDQNSTLTADNLTTINDAIVENGSNTFTMTFSTNASATVVLGGANTYTGGTTVTGGILKYENGTAFGTNSTINESSGATVQVAGDITGGTQTLSIQGVGDTGAGGTGALENVSGNNSYGGQVTIKSTGATISSDAGTLNLAYNTVGLPTIHDGSVGGSLILTGSGNGNIAGFYNGSTSNSTTGGTGALTKNGTGTWTLAGANTYTGGTTVNAGTLGVTGSLASTGALAVNASGNFALGQAAGGSSFLAQTVTTLTLSSSGTTQAAEAALSFNLGASGNDSITTGTLTLTLTGTATGFNLILNDGGTLPTSPETLLTWTSETGLTSVNQIDLTGSSSGITDADLSIQGDSLIFNASAVPEPSTWALLLAGLGLLGWGQRRKIKLT